MLYRAAGLPQLGLRWQTSSLTGYRSKSAGAGAAAAASVMRCDPRNEDRHRLVLDMN